MPLEMVTEARKRALCLRGFNGLWKRLGGLLREIKLRIAPRCCKFPAGKKK